MSTSTRKPAWQALVARPRSATALALLAATMGLGTAPAVAQTTEPPSAESPVAPPTSAPAPPASTASPAGAEGATGAPSTAPVGAEAPPASTSPATGTAVAPATPDQPKVADQAPSTEPAKAAESPAAQPGPVRSLQPDRAQTAADPARIAKAQGQFALDVVARAIKAQKGTANVVVSPASVAAVFGLLDLGAEAGLRDAMIKVMGLSKDTARADFAKIRETMNVSGPGPFTSAGAMLFDTSSKAKPLALEGLKAAGAEVAELNLSTPEALTRVNDWVAGKTRGLIPTILDAPLTNTAFVALNALHFKDRWLVPFAAAQTRQADFTTVAGRTVPVPMMAVTGKYNMREEGSFAAVELAYNDPNYALVIVTTRDKPAEAPKFDKFGAWLAGEGFAERAVELSLPRFELSSTMQLLPLLDEMGLKAARSSRSSLSGFMEAPQFISQIVQKTVLRIDEEGSEAAAATAVVGTRSALPRFFKLTVDKPFIFALRHRPSGALLLAGFVSEPGAAPAKTADAKTKR